MKKEESLVPPTVMTRRLKLVISAERRQLLAARRQNKTFGGATSDPGRHWTVFVIGRLHSSRKVYLREHHRLASRCESLNHHGTFVNTR